jgi:hypothetical protein
MALARSGNRDVPRGESFSAMAPIGFPSKDRQLSSAAVGGELADIRGMFHGVRRPVAVFLSHGA